MGNLGTKTRMESTMLKPDTMCENRKNDSEGKNGELTMPSVEVPMQAYVPEEHRIANREAFESRRMGQADGKRLSSLIFPEIDRD